MTKKKNDPNFEIPKTIRFLPLREYDLKNATLAGADVGVYVWVDFPTSMLIEFDNLTRNYGLVLDKVAVKFGTLKNKTTNMEQRLLGWLPLVFQKGVQDAQFKNATLAFQRSLNSWYARLWSQNPDASTHWTTDQLEKVRDANPRLLEWLCIKSWALIEKHLRETRKLDWKPVARYTPRIPANITSGFGNDRLN
jgi:hypothetical protein